MSRVSRQPPHRDRQDTRDMRAAVLYLVGDAEGRRYHELFSSIHLVKRVLETIFACNIENDGIPAFPRISRLRFLKF